MVRGQWGCVPGRSGRNHQKARYRQRQRRQGKADAKAWKWVASLSALVRPGATYVLFGMYVLFKATIIFYALDNNEHWKDIFLTTWTGEDFAMLNMILTFWFVGRAIERRNQHM